MYILQPSCPPASPPSLRWTFRTHAFIANDCGRVRTITLRLFQTAIFRNSTGSACINRSSQELQTVFQQEHAAYELSCTNLHQPRRNGRSPGRSAAALPSKHPKGRADAERQCRTTSTRILRTLLFLRKDARDPSYRTPSARSSRISKNVSKNNVFRLEH